MASWADVEREEPEFAARVRELMDAHVHKTLATLRADGSPRISGTEARFAEGELWFGGMWGARKARDLQRDPRFALHGGSEDPPAWKGDAKLSGRVEEIADPERRKAILVQIGGGDGEAPAHLFRADIAEVVITQVGEPRDHLVIEHWAEGRGLTRTERR